MTAAILSGRSYCLCYDCDVKILCDNESRTFHTNINFLDYLDFNQSDSIFFPNESLQKLDESDSPYD